MSIRLSVIILSYNTQDLVVGCLESFYQNLPKDIEVILVDNNSADNTVKVVSKQFPRVKIIANKKNLGFAKGNNQGIKQARGKHVLLLNSDTLVEARVFDDLISFAETKPEAGIISPQLLNRDGTIQQNGGSLPNLTNIFFWQFFLDEIPLLTHLVAPYQQEDPEYYTQTRKTGWVSGAGMMLTRKLLDTVGVLDEKIFMYAEDLDLCYRADQAGLEVWSVATTKITHFGQGSGNKAKAIIGEYTGLNYFFAKHHASRYSMFLSLLIYGAKFRAYFLGKIIGKKDAYETFQKAASAIKEKPKV